MNVQLIADLVAAGAFIVALVLLIILTVIDFKVRLLPNKYVFPFAVLGPVFHAALNFSLLEPEQVLIGGVLGYGLFYAIRAAGNWYYKQDSLGLGDVKLMGAAGLWLGPSDLMLAVTIGASVSVLHGIIYSKIKNVPLRRLEIPAGPGLIAGIVVMMGWMVKDLLWMSV